MSKRIYPTLEVKTGNEPKPYVSLEYGELHVAMSKQAYLDSTDRWTTFGKPAAQAIYNEGEVHETFFEDAQRAFEEFDKGVQ